MIELDISNVWTCVSLPELMGSEQEVFDAHLALRNNQPDGPDFMGWLGQPDSVNGRLIHSIRRRADQICTSSDVLVVCGSGSAVDGAKAAVDAYCGMGRNLLGGSPQILFMGDSLSGRQWLELTRLLTDRDFSLHIISETGRELATNVASRGLRWLMERKYGPTAKERISVATPVGTALHKMGQEEGFELFPMPKQMGGFQSALTAAAFIPMAAAGMDPLSVLEGAAEAYEAMDIRSFDNPAWLYAGARRILSEKGRNRELLCLSDPNLAALAPWWNGLVHRREGSVISAEALVIPGGLTNLDDSLCHTGNVFETVIRFDSATRKVPVEMDWKDYDGLGMLAGKNLDYVEEQVLRSMVETHNDAGVPVLEVACGELSAQSVGELLYFFELSAALTARSLGRDPFAALEYPTTTATMSAMGGI